MSLKLDPFGSNRYFQVPIKMGSQLLLPRQLGLQKLTTNHWSDPNLVRFVVSDFIYTKAPLTVCEELGVPAHFWAKLDRIEPISCSEERDPVQVIGIIQVHSYGYELVPTPSPKIFRKKKSPPTYKATMWLIEE